MLLWRHSFGTNAADADDDAADADADDADDGVCTASQWYLVQGRRSDSGMMRLVGRFGFACLHMLHIVLHIILGVLVLCT